MTISSENALLEKTYRLTAHVYDILDFPWEQRYKRWRPKIVGDVHGKVLEAGVGTGRNIPYYREDVELLGLELSKTMLHYAHRRAKNSRCRYELVQGDASVMHSVSSSSFDWLISTFMCCVMPDSLQPGAIAQFHRILKPGGRFKILEIIYSKNPKRKKQQQLFAAFVEKVYGARFDRQTLRYIEQYPGLDVTKTEFLHEDTYLLIEGIKQA